MVPSSNPSQGGSMPRYRSNERDESNGCVSNAIHPSQAFSTCPAAFGSVHFDIPVQYVFGLVAPLIE